MDHLFTEFGTFFIKMAYFSFGVSWISDAKAAEAAQSAYYDPNQPQMAFIPPPAYYVSVLYEGHLKFWDTLQNFIKNDLYTVKSMS